MSKKSTDNLYQKTSESQTVSELFHASGYEVGSAVGHLNYRDCPAPVPTNYRDPRLNTPYNSYHAGGDMGYDRKRILYDCQVAYDEIGIIKSVIDLMSDFGVKGVKVQHEIPAVQRFYQKWWDKINGTSVSERYFNTLYRLGSVPVYRTFGIIGDDAKKRMRAKGNFQKIDLKKYRKNVIPTKYTILNPSTIDVFGKELARFTGKDIFILELSNITKDMFSVYNKSDRKELEHELLSSLPTDLKQAIDKNEQYFRLDEDRFSIDHYKKDDWHNFPKPILYSILRDVRTLNKMKDADDAALDGAISKIRHWVLGRLGNTASETVMPTKSGMKNFEGMLKEFIAGGTVDLVTGPDVTLKETNSDSYKFLGADKYEPTLDSIYNGLGIPAVLRSDKSTSGNEQFISLKTLIERLNYGRNLLKKFWNLEFIRVQKAVGFSKPAILHFDEALIADEVQEKNLLIHLIDRDIISSDAVRERFNFNSDIEVKKISKDDGLRGDKLPYKSGPFHNGNVEHEITKMLIQMGVLVPKETPDTKRFDMIDSVEEESNPKKEGGRPPAVVEDEKRKPKQGDNYRFSKSSGVHDNRFLFAHNLYSDINSKLIPPYLQSLGKNNQRQLTKNEVIQFEKVKAFIAVNYIRKYGETGNDINYKDLTYVPKQDVEYINKILLRDDISLAQKQSLCIIYVSNLLD